VCWSDNESNYVLFDELDLSNDYAELGATYNTFSLDESGDLAKAIEKIGQAVDACFVATGDLVCIDIGCSLIRLS
jgi:hypothetical protein